jgi:hypothetical protein
VRARAAWLAATSILRQLLQLLHVPSLASLRGVGVGWMAQGVHSRANGLPAIIRKQQPDWPCGRREFATRPSPPPCHVGAGDWAPDVRR